MPEVSIIVPVYNVGKYLRECLDSILNQSFKDFELILIDDGSKDKSGQICDEYRSNYSNIIVIHQENKGQASAKNNGVKISKADWILFLDSDDVVHPDLLKYLYNAAIESKSGMAVCKRMFSHNTPMDFFQIYPYNYHFEDVTFEKLNKYYEMDEYFYWAPTPALIKKEVVRRIPFPDGRIYEDNAVSCQLVYASKRLAIVPYILYWYRDNPNGTMNHSLSEKELDYLWALEMQIDFYKKVNCIQMEDIILNALFENAFIIYERCIMENSFELRCKAKRELATIKKKHNNYICQNKKLRRNFDRALRPWIYKIKKKLRVY